MICLNLFLEGERAGLRGNRSISLSAAADQREE
jgi:hypothetical protein